MKFNFNDALKAKLIPVIELIPKITNYKRSNGINKAINIINSADFYQSYLRNKLV